MERTKRMVIYLNNKPIGYVIREDTFLGTRYYCHLGRSQDHFANVSDLPRAKKLIAEQYNARREAKV